VKSIYLLPIFKRLGLSFILTTVVLPANSWAALDAVMRVVHATSGPIEGPVSVSGLGAGFIKVIGFSENISAEFDQTTGLPTGKRQHRPVRIVKEIDQTSPRIRQALYDGGTLSSVTVRFLRPNPDSGATEIFYLVTLTNAHVVSIIPNHISVEPGLNVPETETISLTYEKMNTQWLDTLEGSLGIWQE